MRRREQIVRYFLLLTSVWLLLAYILPHHHHSDGMPCYKLLVEESEEAPAETHDEESHTCACSGHELFFNTSQSSGLADGHALLDPFYVVFEHILSLLPPPTLSLFRQGVPLYIESLHDTWIVAASGLRAPPSDVC